MEDIKRNGGVNSETFWKLKQKFEKRPKEVNVAVYDTEGELVDGEEEIKETYAKYYEELLQTKGATTTEEMETEKIVEEVINQIEAISEIREQQEVGINEVQSVTKKLKKRKATDCDGWKNEMLMYGGNEMVKSLVKIFNNIQKSKKLPDEWSEMRIKPINKKGSVHKMDNKRGLFITNNISKIYERIVKERNLEKTTQGISPFQCGGMKKRSVNDHVFTLLAVIEKNKYLKRNTYITFADAEKCFDRLWLEDGARELWQAGTDISDTAMIYKMNKEARATVACTAGMTREIKLKRVVRQGTVYGPQLCCASTDRINTIAGKITTQYSPELEIQALIFIDDIASAGDYKCAAKTIQACNVLETEKKFTFNLEKSATMVVRTGTKEERITPITAQVKGGRFPQVKKYKYLGTTLTEKASFEGNLQDMRKKLPYRITSILILANERNVGICTNEARINLLGTVIMPSVTISIETWPQFSTREMKDLESLQAQALKRIFTMPKTTPYIGMLMETGVPPMQARIAYKKLMFYHNIINSDDRRIARKIMEAQMNDPRKGTWVYNLRSIAERYSIDITLVRALRKEKWKKMVKEAVRKGTEEELKKKARTMTKMRTVREGDYTMKEYLKVLSSKEASDVMKIRLHMIQTAKNYQGDDKSRDCPMCQQEEDTTEHLFECTTLRAYQQIWNARFSDIMSNCRQDLIRTVKYVQAVQEVRGARILTTN